MTPVIEIHPAMAGYHLLVIILLVFILLAIMAKD